LKLQITTKLSTDFRQTFNLSFISVIMANGMAVECTRLLQHMDRPKWAY